MKGWLALCCYVATIFCANWALATFGLVPVGFGLVAPAGVFCAGLAFVLRDIVQDDLGKRWTLLAIAAGALLSVLVSRQFALASGAAFLLSELADFAIYTPLRKRTWIGAALLSNTAGDVVDSMLFLWLAFGSLHLLAGQLVGKWEMNAVVIGWLAWRQWRAGREPLTFADADAGYRAALAATMATGRVHVGVANPDGSVTVRRVGG